MQQDESKRVFRNHPSVIVSYLLTAAIVMIVLVFLSLREYAWDNKFETIIIVALVMLATLGWAYFFWKRTFYVFEDSEIHVTRDAIYKMDKHIQYTRLASVGVKRDLVNRIFGTSTLIFNVNSSMNAASAEATLVLKKQMADRLRDQLNSMIFEKQVTVEQELVECQTLVRVSNADIVLHAILGQPTWQALFGLLMLFYAVVMLFAESSGGFLTAIVLFGIGEVLPFISVILKYYNYRIYRVGDTVTVESGLITSQRRSFKVNKINSVRIREPLLARLFHKAMLEAEVVGMADEDNNNAPVLCPLKGRKDVEDVLNRLLPELVFESAPERHRGRLSGPVLHRRDLPRRGERDSDARSQGDGALRRSGRPDIDIRPFRNGAEAPHVRHREGLVHVRLRRLRHMHRVHQLRQGAVHPCDLRTASEALRSRSVHGEHDVICRVPGEGRRRGQRQDRRRKVRLPQVSLNAI